MGMLMMVKKAAEAQKMMVMLATFLLMQEFSGPKIKP
jgi:hypothetical protein